MATSSCFSNTPSQALVKTVVYELKSKGIQLNWHRLEKDQVYDLLVSTFESGLSWLSDIEKSQLINYIYTEIKKSDKPYKEDILNQDEIDFISNMIRNGDL
ncbi:hypothetical protein [Celerinatantimonas diazotrophica]|uniref:Uncharacterized protein n=1 Tax=Celerinatantimonas diazotrophica TaxID=412034 RepID=A0A4R1K4B2_9GAMM|nr:hypothetical protein [Celerinatantimonas diazotrophica]TCK58760.1 hypothetical protein EV690_0904 [Celerinatantimonas diazotrophica]CAG9297391.1 hypothetical protein CEDIAZO_02572 [Celerinatantimonas diazotrophica]